MCEFCEQFNASKEISEENGMKINYYAVLQERTVVNGKEKGILNNRPVKLVYCPSCGRSLTEENNIEMKPVIHAHAIIDWLGNCKCSNCESSIDITELYCQHCGATLDEPEERED